MCKFDSVVLVALAAGISMGCGASAAGVPRMPMAALPPTSPFVAAGDEEDVAEVTPAAEEPAAEAGAALPAAPWSAAPIGPDAAPRELIDAWARADNSASCAPLAPAALGAAAGARPRVSQLIEGGWAVEFDRRGMPGLASDGSTCERCGRAVFGIAGTTMAPEELAMDAASSFADGSRVEVEPPAEGETVAAAMITLRDEGCVYQVWSFLGEEHVRELVDGLRRVELGEDAAVAAR